MEQKTVLNQVAETVLTEPVKIKVTVGPCNKLHKWLQDLKLSPKIVVLEIKPTVLGNLIRISKLLLSVDTTALSKSNVLEGNYQLMAQHSETIARVIATAVHNRVDEPPESLVKLILYNFSSTELLTVVKIVRRQMEVRNFMTTIISARGLNVLDSEQTKNGNAEVSPSTPGRQIAHGT